MNSTQKTQLFLLDSNMYKEGSPVLIEKGELLCDLDKTNFSECVVQGNTCFGLKIKSHILVIPNEIVEDYL